MIFCIDERIAQALIARIQTITTAKGYQYNMGERIERIRSSGVDVAPYPLALLLENLPDLDSDYSRVRSDRLNYALLYLDGIDDTEPETDPIFKRLANCHADLIKCLAEDQELNGLCEGISVVDHDITDTDLGWGFVAFIEVQRDIDAENPYEKP